MPTPKLYMLLLGCKPKGRNTEQHDTLFAIGDSLKDLIPQIKAFWPGPHSLHIDAWREVNTVDGFSITVHPKHEAQPAPTHQLFFLNLGGYKQNDFEEYHYKMIVAAPDKGEAVTRAKQTAFYKHTGFKGATSHIDDRYGVDVDDIYEISDILPAEVKAQYALRIEPAVEGAVEDEVWLGYFRLDKL